MLLWLFPLTRVLQYWLVFSSQHSVPQPAYVELRGRHLRRATCVRFRKKSVSVHGVHGFRWGKLFLQTSSLWSNRNPLSGKCICVHHLVLVILFVKYNFPPAVSRWYLHGLPAPKTATGIRSRHGAQMQRKLSRKPARAQIPDASQAMPATRANPDA